MRLLRLQMIGNVVGIHVERGEIGVGFTREAQNTPEMHGGLGTGEWVIGTLEAVVGSIDEPLGDGEVKALQPSVQHGPRGRLIG